MKSRGDGWMEVGRTTRNYNWRKFGYLKAPAHDHVWKHTNLVTRFVEISPLGQHFKKRSQNFCRGSLVFGKILNPLWHFRINFGQIWPGVNNQIMKNNLAIWSHLIPGLPNGVAGPQSLLKNFYNFPSFQTKVFRRFKMKRSDPFYVIFIIEAK